MFASCKVNALKLTAAACLFSASTVWAASPWLPAPGSGTASVSYVYTSADELYAGKTKASLPTDLEQHNVLFNFDYGISDRFAVGVSLGYARTEFIEIPGLSSSSSLDGLIDPRLSFRYKAWDELEDGGVTVTFQAAAIINGGYRTGNLNSIGDGAYGAEFTGVFGKIWENGLGFSAEVGYRYREANVPDEFLTNVSTFYSLAPAFNIPLVVTFNYQLTEALSGIDIGGQGFTPTRFPETEEDFHIVSGALSYDFGSGISANASYGEVIDGRNTGVNKIVGFGLSFSY